jgi:hypothetical protein
MRTSSRTSLITAACALVLTSLGHGQAPGLDLAGTWKLDTYLSDNPQQVAASIDADLRQNDFDLFAGGAEQERGGRETGRRGEPPPQRPQRPPNAPKPEEQRALDAITQGVRYPPPTLRITQTPTAVTIGDAQNQPRTFRVNGKREQQTFDTARADTTAHWEGPQLVIDFDLSKGRKMTCTYSIVPTTNQLMMRVTFERAPNQPGPFEIRFVYNKA